MEQSMMTILLTPIKMVGKIILLLFILPFIVIRVLTKIALNLSAYAVDPFVFLIFGGII